MTAPQSPFAEQQATDASASIPDRYEFKYLISESQVEAVRRAIEPYCVLDLFCEKAQGHEYGISSLYLDTPNRDLFRISSERRALRWKARIRRYDGADKLFLELKHKDHDMVRKQRVQIPFEGWAERARRFPDPKATKEERAFCQRVAAHGLVPMLMVRYQREAWRSSVESYARVTFDRRVLAQPWSDWCFEGDDTNGLPLDGPHLMAGRPHGVVLELKCLAAVPGWLTSVVQDAGLVRARYSKYCKGIERNFARDTLAAVLNKM